MTAEIVENSKINSEFPWELRRFHSTKNKPLISYVLVAEFDIDTGSTLRHQYPSVIPGYTPDYFAESMLPEGAHNRDQDFSYIFLNRKSTLITDAENDSTLNEYNDIDTTFLYGINLVKTKFDQNVRRGAIVKAMAVFSPYHFICEFKEPLDVALESYFENPSIDILSQFRDELNSSVLGAPLPTSLEKLLMRRGVMYNPFNNLAAPPSTHTPERWTFLIDGLFIDSMYNVSIPLYKSSSEFGDISIIKLIQVFGESTMRIFHGIISCQRILFIGYNHAVRDIASLIFSAVAMTSPPLNNILRRVYPYANFSDLSFLEVSCPFLFNKIYLDCPIKTPGYIAGVTNPMFQQKDSWWDVVCVLDSVSQAGSVYTAEERRVEDQSNRVGRLTNPSTKSTTSPPEDNSHVRMDLKFIAAVMSGISANLGEHWVRQQFYDYTMNITNLAQDTSELIASLKLDDTIKKANVQNIARASALAESIEFQMAPTHPWKKTNSSNVISTESPEHNENLLQIESEDKSRLWNHVRRLQSERSINRESDVVAIFKDLDECLKVEEDLQALLVMLPESTGGLTALACGFYHINPLVRFHTHNLFQKIGSFVSTKPAVESLNSFVETALRRVGKSAQTGRLQVEIEEYERGLVKARYVDATVEGDERLRAADVLGIIQPTIDAFLLNADNDDDDDDLDDDVFESLDEKRSFKEVDLIP